MQNFKKDIVKVWEVERCPCRFFSHGSEQGFKGIYDGKFSINNKMMNYQVDGNVLTIEENVFTILCLQNNRPARMEVQDKEGNIIVYKELMF